MWKIVKNILQEQKKLKKEELNNYKPYLINKIFSFDYNYLKIAELVNDKSFENIPNYIQYDFYFYLIVKNKYKRIKYLKKENSIQNNYLKYFFNVSDETLKLILKNLKKEEIDNIIKYIENRRYLNEQHFNFR